MSTRSCLWFLIGSDILDFLIHTFVGYLKSHDQLCVCNFTEQFIRYTTPGLVFIQENTCYMMALSWYQKKQY